MADKLPTDTERREVATRLRKVIGLTEFAEAFGFNWTDDSDWGWKDVSNLVADLIEPAHDHFVESDEKVDRDALLGLADEMDKWALTCDHYDRKVSPLDVTKYARRIREALGVES